MKKILYILFLISAIGLNAQTFPSSFSYQAVARDDSGNVIANKQISVEVSILQGNDCDNGGSCNLVWQEVHFPTTNDLGLFSIDIGDGLNTFAGSAADFDSIAWSDFSSGNYYLKIRVDLGDGDNLNELVDAGTVKLQSVPYCLNSQTANDLERQSGKVPINLNELQDVNLTGLTSSQVLAWNGTQWVNVDASSGGAITLGGLTDVTISSPTQGNVLYFDGTNWLNSNLNIEDLANVNLSSPSNGQFLSFDGTNWINSDVNLSQLGDVNISSPANGQALTWNGSQWVNSNFSGVWTDDGTYVYYNGGNNVGIGTATPRATFEVATTSNGEFIVSGTESTTTGVDLSAGSWLRYLPAIGVFRAGAVTGTQWSNANTGGYSAAFGKDNTASGDYSFAAGRGNSATNTYATVFGRSNTASAISSLVAGSYNTSIGAYSLVVGDHNNTSGTGSGNGSIVGGSYNEGQADYTFTIGNNNTNNGANSILYGDNCSIGTSGFGQGSIVGGSNSLSNADYSAVFGLGNVSQSFASLVIGQYSNSPSSYSHNSWVSSEPVFVIGNGTSSSSRNNAAVIYKDGNMSIEGTYTQGATNPSKAKAISQENYLHIFDLNAYYDGKILGLDADEVSKYFPQLVVPFNKSQNIIYSGFVPLLIETAKYQQNKIDSLETENQELKRRLDELEKRIELIENK